MTTFTAQLQKYYDEKFPIQFVLKFLSHDNNQMWRLENREIMFTIPKVGNKDTYCVRYQTAESEAKFRSLFSLHSRFVQIDVGSVLMLPPSKFEKLHDLSLCDVVKRRELVFDVDLSEYKDVRYCCRDEKRCCKKCWPLAVVAMKFVEKYVRESFSMQQLVWFFSGRRGLHCWVMDEKAGNLSQEQRTAIVLYIHEQRKTFRKCRNEEFHGLKMMVEECRGEFARFVESQELFSNKERFKNLVQGMDLPSFVVQEWMEAGATTHNEFKSIVERNRSEKNLQTQLDKRKFIYDEIMMRCIYPKLDVEVTTRPDHLIKMPFSVHPHTALICMPLTKAQIEAFDPATAANELHIARCTNERIQAGIQAAIEMSSKR